MKSESKENLVNQGTMRREVDEEGPYVDTKREQNRQLGRHPKTHQNKAQAHMAPEKKTNHQDRKWVGGSPLGSNNSNPSRSRKSDVSSKTESLRDVPDNEGQERRGRGRRASRGYDLRRWRSRSTNKGKKEEGDKTEHAGNADKDQQTEETKQGEDIEAVYSSESISLFHKFSFSRRSRGTPSLLLSTTAKKDGKRNTPGDRGKKGKRRRKKKKALPKPEPRKPKAKPSASEEEVHGETISPVTGESLSMFYVDPNGLKYKYPDTYAGSSRDKPTPERSLHGTPKQLPHRPTTIESGYVSSITENSGDTITDSEEDDDDSSNDSVDLGLCNCADPEPEGDSGDLSCVGYLKYFTSACTGATEKKRGSASYDEAEDFDDDESEENEIGPLTGMEIVALPGKQVFTDGNKSLDAEKDDRQDRDCRRDQAANEQDQNHGAQRETTIQDAEKSEEKDTSNSWCGSMAIFGM